jgi:hypothetical protein
VQCNGPSQSNRPLSLLGTTKVCTPGLAVLRSAPISKSSQNKNHKGNILGRQEERVHRIPHRGTAFRTLAMQSRLSARHSLWPERRVLVIPGQRAAKGPAESFDTNVTTSVSRSAALEEGAGEAYQRPLSVSIWHGFREETCFELARSGTNCVLSGAVASTW